MDRDLLQTLLRLPPPPTSNLPQAARLMVPLLDLTSLNEQDTNETVIKLCQQAQTPEGKVACVCIYSQFVAVAKEQLAGTSVKIATVANFPKGELNITSTLHEIEKAQANGTNEIDVVFPYSAYLAGKVKEATDFIKACKQACAPATQLKVILETGSFSEATTIYKASTLVLEAGANFVKTSTGKTNVGATKEAVAAILLAIQDHNPQAGCKVSGGVRTVAQAASYMDMASYLFGEKWLTDEHFRIGASSLLADIRQVIEA